MIKLEGYFQLLVLKVSPSRGGKVWPPPLDHGPPIPPFVHGKYRSIFFLRGVDTSYRNFSLPSLDLLPLAHSLSFQVHRYSKNLTTRRRIFFPRINGSGEKRKKATREFLTRRLILSSIERKKKKNDQSRTRLPIFNGISLRSPRVTKRFFNFTGTKVITVARETIITPSFSLSPSLIVLVEPCNFLFAHAVIFHDQMPPSINVITRVFICPTRARFTGYSGLKIAGIRRWFDSICTRTHTHTHIYTWFIRGVKFGKCMREKRQISGRENKGGWKNSDSRV